MDLMLNWGIFSQQYHFKYEALYHAIKTVIIEGQVEHGSRLPSSRDLASRYDLSRGIVTQVYEMLGAEGYLSMRKGSGTYVSYVSPPRVPTDDEFQSEVRISEWGRRLPEYDVNSPGITFDTSLPSLLHFPLNEWRRSVRQALMDLDYLLPTQSYPHIGLTTLREAIATHLGKSRGISVAASQVVIVNGSIHAMALLAQLLIQKGDVVMVENPTYSRVRNAIIHAGGIPRVIQTDEDGQGIHDWQSKLVYVTPNHQCPTGRVMPYEERVKLLDWSRQQDAYVIEDDIYSDFRRKGRAIEPLKAIDYDDRVAYSGTFFTTILPTVRIGYVILPRRLHDLFLRAKHAFEPYTTSAVEQMAIAHFMKSGGYERHIRRFTRIYRQKYDFLRMTFETLLPDAFTWVESDMNLHLMGWWKRSADEYERFRMNCAAQGVTWESIAPYYMSEVHPGGLFGFSHLTEEEMRTYVHTMAKVFYS